MSHEVLLKLNGRGAIGGVTKIQDEVLNHLDMTMSSILRIILTHSVARVKALVETNDGWTTLSSSMFIIQFFLIFKPACFSPLMCLFLSSVTKLIGLSPAFSARVYGISSRDSP